MCSYSKYLQRTLSDQYHFEVCTVNAQLLIIHVIFKESSMTIQVHVFLFFLFFWRNAKTSLYTLNQKIKLFWWLSAHAHILLIAHEVISINNSSGLLQRLHLSHKSNQMSTMTLNNDTYGPILKCAATKQIKCSCVAHHSSTGTQFTSVQQYIKHQLRE